jgi:LmbE family N-acetylglucosaminyl deacetylase
MFLRRPDGQLAKTSYAGKLVAGIFIEAAPDLVLTLGADGAYGHPDHVAVHQWVVSAWERRHRAFPLLFPVFPKGLFLPQWAKVGKKLGDPPDPPAEAIGADSFDYEVSISSVRSRKRAAIAAHRSQLPGGDPEALFPPGIVRELLDVERFEDASGRVHQGTAEMLASLS